MTMHRDWRSIPEKVREEAIEWRVRLAEIGAGDEDYAAFGEWIASDEAHAAAYEIVELTDGRIDAALALMPVNPQKHVLQRGQPLGAARKAPHFSFNQMMAMAASLALFGLLSVFAAQRLLPPRIQSAEFAAIAAPETILLDDGTSVVLAPGASMTAEIGSKGRNIRDFKGAGFFHVASDSARPFTISFNGKSVTVVGTQFEIQAFADRQSVSVLEGAVRVGEEGSAAAAPVKLSAGEKAEIRGEGNSPVVSSISVDDVAPWRDGVLEFDGASLASVAQSLNEVYGDETFLTDGDSASLVTFSGVLHVAAPQIVGRRLEELLPVSAEFVEGKVHLRRDEQQKFGPSHED